MKRWALLVDPEKKSIETLSATLKGIDGNLEIAQFPDLRALIVWLRERVASAPADAKDIQDSIFLVVAHAGSLSERFVRLLEKASQFFLEKRLSDPEQPPLFVLTAFDHEKLEIKKSRHPIVSNLIFKPFDEPILAQALASALQGAKAPAKGHLYSQKTKAKVEILKEIEGASVSDIGFSTRSEMALKPGNISKFYFLVTDPLLRKGLWARTVQSQAREGGKLFFNSLTFWGGDGSSGLAVRKWIRRQAKDRIQFPFKKRSEPVKDSTESAEVVLLNADSGENTALREFLERNFAGVRIQEFKSYLDLVLDLDPEGTSGVSARSTKFPERLVFRFDEAQAIQEVEPKDYAGPLKDAQWSSFLPADEVPLFLSELRSFFTQAKRVYRFQWSTEDYSFLEFSTAGERAVAVRELNSSERLEFLRQRRRLTQPVDCLFIGDRVLSQNPERLTQLRELLQKHKLTRTQELPTFILAGSELQNEVAVNWRVHDVFRVPWDRSDLLQKIAMACPQLFTLQAVEGMASTQLHFKAFVSREADLVSVSEGGLSIEYERPLKTGEFRSFHFPGKPGEEIVEFLARCQISEEPKQKGSPHLIHFTFFGVTDHHFRYIRNWIREYYVKEKEAAQAGGD